MVLSKMNHNLPASLESSNGCERKLTSVTTNVYTSTTHAVSHYLFQRAKLSSVLYDSWWCQQEIKIENKTYPHVFMKDY